MQHVKGFHSTKNATVRLPHGNVVYRLVEEFQVCNHAVCYTMYPLVTGIGKQRKKWQIAQDFTDTADH